MWLKSAGVARITARGPEFQFYGQALQAAVDGLGIAMGIRPYIDDDLAAGRLVAPFALTVPKGMGIWVIAASGPSSAISPRSGAGSSASSPDRPYAASSLATSTTMPVEQVQTLIIGGGQAGLAMSYRLKQRGLAHLVLNGTGSPNAGGPNAGTACGFSFPTGRCDCRISRFLTAIPMPSGHPAIYWTTSPPMRLSLRRRFAAGCGDEATAARWRIRLRRRDP